MQIISDLDDFPQYWNETCITLGDFDGFHKGHQKLIYRMGEAAREKNLPSVLLTYDPSPKKILNKLKFDCQIFTKKEKIILAQRFPVDLILFFPFSEKTLKLTSTRFLEDILLKQLKMKHLVLGYDHHFGRNREGNYESLKLLSKDYGFTIEKVEKYFESERNYSSTVIRSLIKEGNLKEVNEILGHAYFMSSTVIKGYQRGRMMNIKTANLHIMPEKLIPRAGVYLGAVKYGSEILRCVINIGNNPTFKNSDMSIEVHILNFNRNIYGETIRLYFLERIRDEIKFESIDLLKEQIIKDIDFSKSRTIENHLLV